ncbi:hypothetical protein EYF80_049899 [Liparis tanakae]|uniref:Uncharacterized protein n=1 Tax=Liparis tanakae TaxID=230148 RepID=A0A4Z2FI19_9TELE|nr:hypothetical protein EYF80_049899 [Liparis tanakae]
MWSPVLSVFSGDATLEGEYTTAGPRRTKEEPSDPLWVTGGMKHKIVGPTPGESRRLQSLKKYFLERSIVGVEVRLKLGEAGFVSQQRGENGGSIGDSVEDWSS